MTKVRATTPRLSQTRKRWSRATAAKASGTTYSIGAIRVAGVAKSRAAMAAVQPSAAAAARRGGSAGEMVESGMSSASRAPVDAGPDGGEPFGPGRPLGLAEYEYAAGAQGLLDPLPERVERVR